MAYNYGIFCEWQFGDQTASLGTILARLNSPIWILLGEFLAWPGKLHILQVLNTVACRDLPKHPGRARNRILQMKFERYYQGQNMKIFRPYLRLFREILNSTVTTANLPSHFGINPDQSRLILHHNFTLIRGMKTGETPISTNWDPLNRMVGSIRSDNTRNSRETSEKKV